MGENAPQRPITLACRCEEIASEEIAAAIMQGARSVDDVKRRTRAGMGLCQGIYCMPAIAAMVAQATGTRLENLVPMTARPPVRPLSLDALGALDPNEWGLDRSDVGDDGD